MSSAENIDVSAPPAPATPDAVLLGSAPERLIRTLQAACDTSPGATEPRIALAGALLIARRAAEALFPAEQAVALAPDLPAAIEMRDAALAALQAGDPALVKLELTCALDPSNADAQLTLGEAYAAAQRPIDAERHLKLALALGRAGEAHADLAALYLSVGMTDAAEHHAGAALQASDPTASDQTPAAMAHQTLAAICKARGDDAGAARQLDQAYARQSLFRQPVAGSAFTTLVLVTRETGNLPYKALLPPTRFDYAVWYMEHARAEQIADLPAYAVVLNAIGDPDAAAHSAAAVDAFLDQCARPVINRPARVRLTARDRLGETLAGLEDVIVPTTVRVSAADMAAGRLGAILADRGLLGPALLRPTGSHGGEGLVLAEDAEALPHGAPADGADRYVTRFHDYRSADGFYRKYRMIFVDRRPWPYHLAISRQWMVHHQTAEMADDPARIVEEMRFLSDPTDAIGPKAMAAVAAIGTRLDLDYGGVDFSLTAAGEVLVFEANATMLTHLEPPGSPFLAKNLFVQPIIDTFQAHVARLAEVAGNNLPREAAGGGPSAEPGESRA